MTYSLKTTISKKESLTEFDISYKREKLATLPVNGVIKGWTEALQIMKEGSKWQIFIPVFYVVIQKTSEKFRSGKQKAAMHNAPPATASDKRPMDDASFHG
ncbi:MAG TPA: FKBP-type peptidyl-prolyl cis-trans isomerase [Desulfobacterales bacterium]|nr:FKBP-type peptidyl-prolyl cis-trans isomerase [Desulfobacterales bacterium]